MMMKVKMIIKEKRKDDDDIHNDHKDDADENKKVR